MKKEKKSKKDKLPPCGWTHVVGVERLAEALGLTPTEIAEALGLAPKAESEEA